MNRSFAVAAARAARFSSAVRSPFSMRAEASTPFSMIWASSRSSRAVRSGTRPISLRYWPTESLMTHLSIQSRGPASSVVHASEPGWDRPMNHNRVTARSAEIVPVGVGDFRHG